MKKSVEYYNIKEYYPYGFLILIIGGMWIGFNIYLEDNSQNALQAIAIGTTDAGDVVLELIPLEIKSDEIIIQVRANTHSVDLSQFDLRKNSILDYNGNSYTPSQAPFLQGHHVSGDLVFPIKTKDLDSFRITIKGIPLQQERIYYWEV